MHARSTLEALLGPSLWRGKQALVTAGHTTGIDALDAVLPGRGWPANSLIEVLLTTDGIGELTLLLPTIARATSAGRDVALVGAPYIPYAPAWQRAGVNLQRLHVVDVNGKRIAWAFEQILRSASCAAVMAWPNAMDPTGLRRLQLAASEGHSLGFLLCDQSGAPQASPAALRLELQSDRQVLVRKCRGGMPVARPVPLTAVH